MKLKVDIEFSQWYDALNKSVTQEGSRTGIKNEVTMTEGCCEAYGEARLLEPVGIKYHGTRSFCIMKRGALSLTEQRKRYRVQASLKYIERRFPCT